MREVSEDRPSSSSGSREGGRAGRPSLYLGSVEIVNSENGAALILVRKETKTLAFARVL